MSDCIVSVKTRTGFGLDSFCHVHIQLTYLRRMLNLKLNLQLHSVTLFILVWLIFFNECRCPGTSQCTPTPASPPFTTIALRWCYLRSGSLVLAAHPCQRESVAHARLREISCTHRRCWRICRMCCVSSDVLKLCGWSVWFWILLAVVELSSN